MKIDRFVKAMLVLIALLLALNCAKDLTRSSNSRGGSSNPAANSASSSNMASSKPSDETPGPSIFETEVEAASAPTFLQIGKTYTFMQGSGGRTDVEVLEIQSTGWIKGKDIGLGVVWVNPSACYLIYPSR
jgi:predicted extracellular nuclease